MSNSLKRGRTIRFALALTAIAIGTAARAGDPADAIRPYQKNPFYWQHRGEPVLLLGGSVEDNLFQIPNLAEHLDVLKSAGGNYVRNTMSCRDPGNVWPFGKSSERYDLDTWNDEFWTRFETFLAETAKRKIFVQIEVWATFDYYREPWLANPFNPKNNLNYSAEESGLPVRVDSHPLRLGNSFFRSVPGADELPVVLEYQRRFVDKLLSHSLEYDHVLYCIDNETAVTPKWGAYWARFIRDKAGSKGKRVHVTEMWDPWNLDDAKHRETFDHPELYSFVDISQNNHQKGQRHYTNGLAIRKRLSDRPRPIDNVKIYGADGGRFGSTRDGVERFWRNIFAGFASARFHRPDSGIGLSRLARRMIRSARVVTGAIDLFACAPRNDLLGERRDNEAYCLANPGVEYIVYFPRGGEVALKVEPAGGSSVRWHDVDEVRWAAPQQAGKGNVVRLKTPGDGQWVALVRPTADTQ